MTKPKNDISISDKIMSPKELGITSEGSALSSNIDKLFNGYVKLLTSGGTMAVRGGKYLGNRYISSTGTKCVTKNGKKKDRSVFFDTIPCNKKEKGLMAGVISGISNINSSGLMKAIKTSGKTQCTKVSVNTVDENNLSKIEDAYISNDEIKKITPCSLVKIHDSSRENFNTFDEFVKYNVSGSIKRKKASDIIETLFISSFGLIMIYYIFKISKR